jgi:hypothetical protein
MMVCVARQNSGELCSKWSQCAMTLPLSSERSAHSAVTYCATLPQQPRLCLSTCSSMTAINTAGTDHAGASPRQGPPRVKSANPHTTLAPTLSPASLRPTETIHCQAPQHCRCQPGETPRSQQTTSTISSGSSRCVTYRLTAVTQSCVK